MRVAVLNPKGSASYSGPSVLISRLQDGLAQLGAEDSLQADRVEPAMFHMEPRRHDVSTRRGQAAWAIRSCFWLLLRGRQYDVLHLHGTYLYSLAPALVARLIHKPYVLFPLSAGGDLALKSRSNRLAITRALRRFAVSGAKGGLALAPQIADELIHWGLNPDLVEPIYNPVSRAFMSISDDTSRAPRGDGRTVVFIGKLSRRKSPELILDALARLKDLWPEARAVFVGPFESDAYRSFFEGRASELEVSASVTVTGHVDDVARWVGPDTSVFLLPSTQEGLPGALAEVMACGIPVGVSQAGAMPSVVEAAQCGRVLPRDGRRLADFVSELWSREDLWQEFSEAGVSFARRHLTDTAVARTYRTFLGRVVRSTGR